MLRVTICLALALGWPQPVQCVLFRATQATTVSLDEVAVLSGKYSAIHCASSCRIATSDDDCAAFHYESVTKEGSCGRRMNFEVRRNESNQYLHSNILCNKPIPPGNIVI